MLYWRVSLQRRRCERSQVLTTSTRLRNVAAIRLALDEQKSHATETRLQLEVSPSTRRLLNEIHESLFHRALNVRTACLRCGIGDHNVGSRFYFEVGESIQSYIVGLRVECVAACLGRGWPIGHVAHAAGFANLQTFYRAFGAKMGLAPGGWLRQQTWSISHQPGGASRDTRESPHDQALREDAP